MNKRFLAIGLAGLLTLSIVGCGDGGASDDRPADGGAEAMVEAEAASTQTVSYGGASIEVPATWEIMDDVDGKYANPEYGGLVSLHASELDYGEMSADWAYSGIIAGFAASGQFTASDDVERLTVGGAPAYRTEIALQRDDGHFKGTLEIVLTGDRLYSVMYIIPDQAYDEHSADIVPVLDSLVIDASASE